MRHNFQYLIIIIALIGLTACQDNQKKSDAYGNFEVNETIISAETNGKLLYFPFNEGDIINAEDILAVIDTSTLSLSVTQIDAQIFAVKQKVLSIDAKKGELDARKKAIINNIKRVKNLLNDGAATQKQLDDLEDQLMLIERQYRSVDVQYPQVEAEINVLEAQRETLIDQIDRCRIKSVLDGTVLASYANVGEVTTAGKPLLKVADLSNLELKVYVSGAQLPHIKIGQEVEVLIDENSEENRALTGKIIWISEQSEFTPKIIQTKEERVKLVYAVKLSVDNDGSLKIGMPAEINF